MAGSPVLLLATVLIAGFAAMAESVPSASYLKYSTVIGYFLQDNPATDPSTFDYVRLYIIDLHQLDCVRLAVILVR